VEIPDLNVNSQTDWPAWITAIVSVATALGIIFRLFFTNLEQKQQERHVENLAKFDTLFERVGDVGERVSKLEGKLEDTGRFPRITR
jgi:hypothetical protein